MATGGFKRDIFDQLSSNPQTGTMAMGIGSILIILFMVFFAIRPAVVSVISQLENNERRTELLKEQDVKLATLKKLIEQKQNRAEDVAKLNESMPTFDNVEYTYTNIADYISNQPNIELLSSSFEYENRSQNRRQLQVDTSLNPEIIEFDISVVSSTEEVQGLFEFLENSPRIIGYKNVASSPFLEEDEGQNVPYDVRMTMTLEIFYLSSQT